MWRRSNPIDYYLAKYSASALNDCFDSHGVWIACSTFSAAKAFDQAGADHIEVVSGIAVIRVNREDKSKHKRAVNTCRIKYAESFNQFSRLQPFVFA
jgi:hypothetical protein